MLEGGRIVGFVGAERTSELICIIDKEWGSPHRRMKVLMDAHKPIRKELEGKGYRSAHVWTDPAFPNFGRRLARLGAFRELWDCYCYFAKKGKL